MFSILFSISKFARWRAPALLLCLLCVAQLTTASWAFDGSVAGIGSQLRSPQLPVAEELPLTFPGAFQQVETSELSAQPLPVPPPAELPIPSESPAPGLVPEVPVEPYSAPQEDEIWLVSTRGMNLCNPHDLRVSQCSGHGWEHRGLQDLLADQDPSRPVVFWIHGNRTSHQVAISEGMQMYRALKYRACRPFRFVIWSWCSNKTDRPVLKDLKYKAHLAHQNVYPFGWLLAQFNPQIPLSVVSYSYGARITLGGAHLLGGGNFMGHSLHAELPSCREPVRVVLIAGAADANGLLPGHLYGHALRAAAPILVYKNQFDPALKWYPLLFQNGAAMGHSGPRGRPGGTVTSPVGLIVGRSHDWRDYLDSRLVNEFAPVLLFQN